MGKVTTYLTPCHLAHVPTQHLIISPQEEAADRPCGIDSGLEN